MPVYKHLTPEAAVESTGSDYSAVSRDAAALHNILGCFLMTLFILIIRVPLFAGLKVLRTLFFQISTI